MERSADANWWQFAIDPEERGEKITAQTAGLQEVNPLLPDGRRLLDYSTYLGLDQLLTCQVPSSQVPDERVFIVTHQLFELAFKLMIFDLSVLATTFAGLLDRDAATFHSLCTGRDESFWLPARTASGRLTYVATTLLPAFAGLLAQDETFSSREFSKFRPHLQPASGFQSARFRLIQRALGKAGLLTVRLFPAQEYWRHYEAAEDRGPARVDDPVILRADAAIADPAPASPLAPAARLDDLAHRLLARLGTAGGNGTPPPEIPAIPRSELEKAVAGFRRLLAAQRSQQEGAGTKPADAAEKDQAATALFGRDLESAIDAENERRTGLQMARQGACFLHTAAPQGELAEVLNCIVATDTALHGRQEGSFLALHFRFVAARLHDLFESARQAGTAEPPRGTGGGGLPYLKQAHENLVPLFPALVAWRDLPAGPVGASSEKITSHHVHPPKR
jgi:tryptophan 2,3-dioxygenase